MRLFDKKFKLFLEQKDEEIARLLLQDSNIVEVKEEVKEVKEVKQPKKSD